jgi:hypothetical protein
MIPMIRGTSPALADFSFEKLDLGEIVCDRILRESFNPFFFCIQPPRIGGVKVYTENIRDQIMMDIEVLYVYHNGFYSS